MQKLIHQVREVKSQTKDLSQEQANQNQEVVKGYQNHEGNQNYELNQEKWVEMQDAKNQWKYLKKEKDEIKGCWSEVKKNKWTK